MNHKHLALPILLVVACQLLPSFEGGLELGAPGTLSVDEIRASLKEADAHKVFVPVGPVGMPADLSAYIPADNLMTKAKVELGRQLYFDPRLSGDGTIACASCHHPDMGWTDNAAFSTGIHGHITGVGAPTVMNRILGSTQFWDGRAETLELQAEGPVAAPGEMGFTWDAAEELCREIEGYELQFQAVFGASATKLTITQAMATFERTIFAGGSPYDHFERATPFYNLDMEEETDAELIARYEEAMKGEEDHPMTEASKRGRELFFGKASCSACHVGPDLSDEQFHNIGIGQQGEEPFLGRFAVTGDEADRGATKTPGLHNIADSAPYMHDGSEATLVEVILHYNRGGMNEDGTTSSHLSDKIFKLNLTEEEIHDLAEFLEQGLTGEVTPVEIPRLP
jgi:cytochrome c peroxidase